MTWQGKGWKIGKKTKLECMGRGEGREMKEGHALVEEGKWGGEIWDNRGDSRKTVFVSIFKGVWVSSLP